jgi:hypothetical protein
MEKLNMLREKLLKPLKLLSLFLFLIGFSGCEENGLTRPYGYLRLGRVEEFIGRRTFLTRDRLLLRRDERGLSVMSTLCTHDLTPLYPEETPHGIRLVSRYTTSQYDLSGIVVQGPAKHPLPYYELRLASNDERGIRDNLYVYIGMKVNASWRLPLPPSLEEQVDKTKDL